MAFSKLEPFGSRVDDYRAGIAPAMRVNSHLAEGAERITPPQLFPWYEADQVEQAEPSPAEVAANVIGLFQQVTTGKG